MQTFALIVLISLLIALTHTHNYVLRLIVRKNMIEDAGMFCFFSSLFYGVLITFILKYIILWGYPLIA